METNNSTILSNARGMPYFKTAKEPEKPINDRSRGLQKGHVVVKKLRNAPIKPTLETIDFCLLLTAKTCNAINAPPRIENITKNKALILVKAILILSSPNRISIKFVNIA